MNPLAVVAVVVVAIFAVGQIAGFVRDIKNRRENKSAVIESNGLKGGNNS